MISTGLRLWFIFLICFILTIIPMPGAIKNFSPPWILLVIIYVQFFLSNYFHIALIIFLGLCMDVLSSAVMGEHVLALILTTWVASSRVEQFKFFSLIQQMMLIALFCLIYQGIIFFTDIVLGYQGGVWLLAGSTLMSIIFWPWVRMISDRSLLN